LSFEEAEAVVNGTGPIGDEQRCRKIISDACEELSAGINRSISFLKTAGDAEQLDEVILSGGGARVPGLREILSEKHGTEFKVNDSVSKVAPDDKLDSEAAADLERLAPMLTVSLGLALRREGN